MAIITTATGIKRNMVNQTVTPWVPSTRHRDILYVVQNTNAKRSSASTLSGRLPCCTRQRLTKSKKSRNPSECVWSS